MSDQTKNGTSKSRGRPATGKGTQIQVRVSPELLNAIDGIAAETGITRPDVLRAAMVQWAEAHDLIPPPARLREVPIMVMLDKTFIEKLSLTIGKKLGGEDIAAILSDWLKEQASDA